MEYYTSVCRYGNNILYRGYSDGRAVKKKIPYKPTLYVSNGRNSNSPWKSISGKPLQAMPFDGMKEASEFIAQYKDVKNIEVHGMNNFVSQFINEKFNNIIDFNADEIKIAYLDIEVFSDEGFPEPEKAEYPVTAVCIRLSDSPTYLVWGTKDYDNKREDVRYVKCHSETDLLLKLSEFWRLAGIDVITGWNTKLFDMPYLINRTAKLLGEDTANKYSPWGVIQQRSVNYKGRKQLAYEIYGIEQLDYLDLFIKFGILKYGVQESYKLDHIAHVVLGMSKLSYEEYGNLHTLYIQDHQKFIDYNIRDVELIYALETKLELIRLAYTIAYKSGSNYSDAFGTTSLWDNYIYRSLDKEHIVVPPKKEHYKTPFPGGYVKDVHVGRHEWVVSFDLNSLYPHLIMQYNMSPETILDSRTDGVTVENCLSMKRPDIDDESVAVAANGVHFRKDQRGIIPAIIEGLYAERSLIKKNMLSLKQRVQDGDAAADKEIAKLDTQQMAIKIMMNSLYGAIGNCYFRYYDLRIAEGITLSGQLSIRWAERAVNQYMNKILKTDNVDYVVASDTDSIYINFGPMVRNNAMDLSNKSKIVDILSTIAQKNFLPVIEKAYTDLAEYMQAYENRMVMGREVIADAGIWTAKKRYILNVYDSEGVRYANPELKIMGIEAVKSSTPQSCRTALKDLFKVIIAGEERQVQKSIEKFREKFYSLPADEIAFPRGVSSVSEHRDAYAIYKKGTPIHSRGSLLYNHYIRAHKLEKTHTEIKNGDKIKFVYLKEPNPIRENVIAFPEFLPKELGLDKYIDYQTQFDKAFLAVVDPILTAINWTSKEVSNLDAFF